MAGDRSLFARLSESVLRVRLFYKVLLANAVIVGVAAVASATIADGLASPHTGLSVLAVVVLVGGTAVAISLVVNVLILRIAFRPLWQLEATAERLADGELEARAPASPLADAEFARLVETFNAMVDRLGVYRERYREIASRTIHAAEQERTRIALELHDDTAQSLASLLVRLRAARAATDPETRSRLLDEVRDEVAAAAERVRRFARGLRPPALDMLGLPAAIESHVRELSGPHGIALDLELQPVNGSLSSEQELVSYRIVQEALANAVRHADARRVAIHLVRKPDTVRVMVEDDGKGFALDAIEADGDRGLGLFGMRERASQIGADLDILSEPGLGTRVVLTIPLDEKEVLIHA